MCWRTRCSFCDKGKDNTLHSVNQSVSRLRMKMKKKKKKNVKQEFNLNLSLANVCSLFDSFVQWLRSSLTSLDTVVLRPSFWSVLFDIYHPTFMLSPLPPPPLSGAMPYCQFTQKNSHVTFIVNKIMYWKSRKKKLAQSEMPNVGNSHFETRAIRPVCLEIGKCRVAETWRDDERKKNHSKRMWRHLYTLTICRRDSTYGWGWWARCGCAYMCNVLALVSNRMIGMQRLEFIILNLSFRWLSICIPVTSKMKRRRADEWERLFNIYSITIFTFHIYVWSKFRDKH